MGSRLMRSVASPAQGFVLTAALLAAGACRDTAVPPSAQRATSTEIRELSPAPGALALPLKQGSIRFAVIGDSGRGDDAQHDVARQMVAWRSKFPFDFVVMLGDNIYPPHSPDDYVRKFEEPYRALLAAGVTFYAAIGNHDQPSELDYPKFNMGGKRYYTFRRNERRVEGLAGAGVRFFVLDSRSLDPGQLAWLQDALAKSETQWKICYFHHPLYTSGRYVASARALRTVLEPLLLAGDVDVVLTGHEHFYERLQPQHGIAYFISGGAGSLRKGDIRPSPLMGRGFDTDYHFMMMEVSGDTLYFQAISRTGETVDAGEVTRRSGKGDATVDTGSPR
jgi:predicted phosphodiesterase